MSKRRTRTVSLAAATLVILLCSTAEVFGAPGTALAAGEETEAARQKASGKTRWVASWLVLAAVQALDLHSSLGHSEANPLLRNEQGRFAPGRAVLFKSALAGGLFSYQWWRLHARPERSSYRRFTLFNSVAAGALAGAVVHNYSLPRPAPSSAPVHLVPEP